MHIRKYGSRTEQWRLLSLGLTLLAMTSLAALGIYGIHDALAQDGKPVGRKHAVFEFACKFSHRAPDDPIVAPGRPGAAHMHDFYGNVTTDALSTTDSLRAGSSSCIDEPLDTAAYWQPSIGMQASDGTITWLKPSAAFPYYQYGGTDDTPPLQQFPLGLRMVAGSAKNTDLLDTDFIYWQCVTNGSAGEIDKTPAVGEMPVCDAGYHVSAVISFPDCWDGIWLYPQNPASYSHMVYSGGTPAAGPDCPADHPVKLPELHLRLHWRDFQGSSDAFLSSDLMTPAGAANHGRSLHADFWNAWDPGRLKQLVTVCLNSGTGCQLSEDSTLQPVPDGTLPGPYPEGQEPSLDFTAPGDINRDSRVNALDLSLLISHDGLVYAPGDFNHDAVIDGADMAILLGAWTW